MYEAEHLVQAAEIEYPSIFKRDANAIIVSRGSTDSELSNKTWGMLLARNINTTPTGIRQWSTPTQ